MITPYDFFNALSDSYSYGNFVLPCLVALALFLVMSFEIIHEGHEKYPLELRVIWYVMRFWPSQMLSSRAHKIYNNLKRDGKEDG